MRSLRTARALATATALLALLGTATPATAGLPRQSGGITPSVVGGHDATRAYPAMASLQVRLPDNTYTHACGASLVHPRYVVTGAHCVTGPDGRGLEPGLFQLRIGSADRTSGGTVVAVAEVLPHPEWDWGAGGGRVADLALLRLARPVSQVPFLIAPVVNRTGAARIIGWGSVQPDAGGSYPIRLQELDTSVLPADACAGAGIGEGDLCLDSPGGVAGICIGDSGGPALQQIVPGLWAVVGIASRGSGSYCGQNPAVFTDLTYYQLWVYQVLLSGSVR
ncbi:S1 family peptidase [Micromonospora sp. NPDC093277]|uniref:S1 family peptidase n=1 Tax=Micromonospora sp. NPDC093277 TaxID=3364291 RepID=UPI00381A2305